MKILIITQKINTGDPVLGFFHRWVGEFAKHYESVTVICLERGDYNLPENVKVLSLGKEEGRSKAQYLSRFFRYVWNERGSYDAVLVHMNQEYVLLAGWLWKILNKRIYMWRNHYAGSLMTDLAALFCDKVFYTSSKSYTARYKKAVQMPVGIDTLVFKPDGSSVQKPNSILSLGRISPSKNIHVLVSALAKLREEGRTFSADIYGNALPADSDYLASVKAQIKTSGLENMILLLPGVANTSTPDIYREHQVFVNASPGGMYDKTILEAAACGCRVAASSPDAQRDLPTVEFFKIEEDDLARALKKCLDAHWSAEQALEQYKLVEEKHSLKRLAAKLVSEMK